MRDGIQFAEHDAFIPLRFDLDDLDERETWATDLAKTWRTSLGLATDWGREQVLAAQLLVLADRKLPPALSYAVVPDLAQAALGSFDVDVVDTDDVEAAAREVLDSNNGVVAEPEITRHETTLGTSTRIRERILLDVQDVVFSRTSYLTGAPAEFGGVILGVFLTPDLADAQRVLPLLDQFADGLRIV